MGASNKAHAGGIVGAATVLLHELLNKIPFVAGLSEGSQVALEVILAALVGWAIVYLAPANRQSAPPAPPSGAILGLVLVAVLATGCAAKAPSSLTPAGVRAWQANQAVLALNTVQRGAIGLNAIERCDTVVIAADGQAEDANCRPLVSDRNTRLVIDVHAQAVTSIAEAPSSWWVVATEALVRIRNGLDADGRTTLAEWLDFARVLMEDLR